ncbi:hypothetical protein BJ546DRAFT_946241 [Cryomyces antarcticus]
MAEPQPADVHEGDDIHSVPANAEDRKTAAALSSLDKRGDDDEITSSKKEGVDSEALGKAMKNLDSKDVGKGKQEEVVKKAVKVDQADVGLLVKQLDLTKAKATDLLKSHDGDAVKAMTAFVTAPA